MKDSECDTEKKTVDADVALAQDLRDGDWGQDVPEVSFFTVFASDKNETKDSVRREWQWFGIAYQELRDHFQKHWKDATLFPVGSFTKGTAVSPEQSDLDVVLLVPDFTPDRYDELMVRFEMINAF